jgi:hypothetical protein
MRGSRAPSLRAKAMEVVKILEAAAKNPPA